MAISRSMRLEDPSAPRAHVLVAIVDEPVRSRVVDALIEDGHRVSVVEDGVALFERLDAPRAAAPDLVIAEIEIDGLSAVEVLAMTEDGARPTTILVSSRADSALEAAARRVGAAALVASPIDVAALRRVVRGALASCDAARAG